MKNPEKPSSQVDLSGYNPAEILFKLSVIDQSPSINLYIIAQKVGKNDVHINMQVEGKDLPCPDK